LKHAISLCPSDASLYDGLALLLIKHRDFDASLQWIHRGLRVAPNSPELRLDLSVTLLAVGRAAEALSILKRLPKGPQTEFYLGMAYRSLGDHKAARQAFSRAVGLGHKDPYVLYTLIQEDRALKDTEAGLAHFQTFYQRFPNSPFLHLLVGNAFVSRDRNAEAEQEFQEALKQNPDLPTANFQLGYLKFKQGQYSAAADLFRKETELDPAFREALLYLGASLHRLGKNEEAIPILEQAKTRDPNSRLTYRELVAAQIEAKQTEAALRELKSAIKRFPDEQALHAQLAMLLTKLGREKEAKKEAELAQTLSKQGVKRRQADLESVAIHPK
jgi:tetratricopeptide (TPR) repeat protein